MNQSRIVLFIFFTTFCCVSLASENQYVVNIDKIHSLPEGSFLLIKSSEGPIWVIPRSLHQVKYLQSRLKTSNDPFRSIRPEILVVKPVCGCAGSASQYLPRYLAENDSLLGGKIPGGFWCEHDNILYDIAGRVVHSKCKAEDFKIPKYEYIDEKTIQVFTNGT